VLPSPPHFFILEALTIRWEAVILANLKASLEKQIEMLEKVQEQAQKDGNMQKVQEIAHTIITLANMINSMK